MLSDKAVGLICKIGWLAVPLRQLGGQVAREARAVVGVGFVAPAAQIVMVG